MKVIKSNMGIKAENTDVEKRKWGVAYEWYGDEDSANEAAPYVRIYPKDDWTSQSILEDMEIPHVLPTEVLIRYFDYDKYLSDAEMNGGINLVEDGGYIAVIPEI